ncbi:MAG TPA: hypothetical protein PLE78_13350 [Flavobacteriales bacterium]|nr:hypothetical protein [Flavobacteriales bacterium]
MLKAIAVFFLSLAILLFGGVGQFAAKTLLSGDHHSSAGSFMEAVSKSTCIERSFSSELNECPSVHAGSGAFILDIPILETEDDKLNFSKKQVEQKGRWDVIARTFGMHTSVFQQSIAQVPAGQSLLSLQAIKVLYLVFGVLRL